MGSLLTFGAGDNFKRYLLSFLEGLKTFDFNCGEMCEQIFAAFVGRDETEAFGIVKPLDNTVCHFYSLGYPFCVASDPGNSTGLTFRKKRLPDGTLDRMFCAARARTPPKN